MAMFRKDPEIKAPAPPQPASERRNAPTWIAPGCKITGRVGGTADLQIDGEIEGEVRVETAVSVGASGLVRGEIFARAVRIGGRVVGNVKGSERVEVQPAGTLEGDVASPRVVIAEGAFVKGKVEMGGPAKGEKI